MTIEQPFTVDKIAILIQEAGYRAKIYRFEKYSCIGSSTNGLNFNLFCLNKKLNSITDNHEHTFVVRISCFLGQIEYSDKNELLKICNEFNSRYLSCKATIKEDEELVIWFENCIYITDNLSESTFIDFFIDYCNLLEIFCRLLDKYFLENKKSELIENHDRAVKLVHSIDNLESIEEGVKLYRYNANMGYAGSQNNFGDLFEKGLKVSKSDLLAVYWYTRAAERGEPTAFLSLASILSKESNNQDALVIATQFVTLATRLLPDGKNKAEAIDLLENLKTRLSNDLIEYTDNLVSLFEPLYQERWLMSDAPGNPITFLPGSDLIN
jgi:hypothetical protein